jgi:hypothetical protein
MRSLVVAVLFACSGSKPPPPESPAPPSSSLLDCATVADHVASTVAAGKPRSGATLAAVKDMVATRCQADAWSDDTKQCLHAIATIKDGRTCAEKMTDAQRDAIRTQAKALRAEPAPEPDDHGSDWIRHVVEGD